MYKAKKPCHFQGKTYRIGQPIPDGAFDISKVSALIKLGLIEEADGAMPKATADESESLTCDVHQTAQDAPESIENAEMENLATDTENAVKTGRRGGRKKAEA